MDTRLNLFFMEREFARDGYVVINKTYPSVSLSIEECADYLAATIEREAVKIRGPYELNFVAHSMGGLVVRCYLNKYQPKEAKRFVMISTPNRGVMKAELAARVPLADKILGPAGMEMARGRDFLCALCGGAPHVEFGIIAGGRGDDKGYSGLIPGDDDGTVAAWSAYLPGAADYLMLNHVHRLICFQNDTIDNTRAFLESGSFLIHSEVPR
jgi:pimeloyl-ACP methyl ester carboxylesterase